MGDGKRKEKEKKKKRKRKEKKRLPAWNDHSEKSLLLLLKYFDQ